MAQPLPGDPNDATTPDVSAASPGPTPERTQADSEATGTFRPPLAAEATQNLENATGNWSPQAAEAEATTNGNGASGHLTRGTAVRYFGDYEIQKELGRCGMGVVYKARQVTLNRLVALKMIKAGVLADHDELRRFQNEAEAVALLDHGGIVPVYEVGEHDGQRYFSMKLVEGGNLADQLAAMKDNPRAAATLLAETAEAVHHAHMRGILHRDLKPANILVDAEGHPHVTDFGLAKRVEGDIEMTQSGAILGTPAYMSPEQANGRRGSITTATDIYGLGAILYALLTDKAPFGGDSLMETLDAVRTRPPDSPRKFNPNTPRDLETICLKCLEKDPRRRYPSAHELAVELKNWLDSRPISARRVGGSERAWLWCKRKPVVAALAAAVLLTVVGGTTAIIAVQALANKSLDRQRLRSEDRETRAIDAVKRYGDAVTNEKELKNNPALAGLRRRLLKEPLAFLKDLRDRLQADRDTTPESLDRLVETSLDLGKLTGEIGDREDAVIAYRESLTIGQELVNAHPTVDKYQNNLATSHNNLGTVLRETGKPADAIKAFQSALAIRRMLADANPTVTKFQDTLAATLNNIGLLLNDTGKLVEARKSFDQALAIQQKLAEADPSVTDFQFHMSATLNNIGSMQRGTGKTAEALKTFQSALAILQKLADVHPTVTEFQHGLANTHNGFAVVLTETGKPAEALQASRSSVGIYQKLADAHPTITEFQNNLATSHLTVGVLLGQTGKPAEAMTSYESALAIFEKLARDHPESPEFASHLAVILHNLAGIDLTAKRFEKAAVLYRQAIEWQRKALAMNPANTTYRGFMAMHLRELVQAARGSGDSEGAAEAERELVKLNDSAPPTVALEERPAIINHAEKEPVGNDLPASGATRRSMPCPSLSVLPGVCSGPASRPCWRRPAPPPFPGSSRSRRQPPGRGHLRRPFDGPDSRPLAG